MAIKVSIFTVFKTCVLFLPNLMIVLSLDFKIHGEYLDKEAHLKQYLVSLAGPFIIFVLKICSNFILEFQWHKDELI